jgi:hypothetical protein
VHSVGSWSEITTKRVQLATLELFPLLWAWLSLKWKRSCSLVYKVIHLVSCFFA